MPLPDPEAAIVDHLDTALTAPVSTRRPSGAPPFVLVRRDGGAADRHGILDRPRMNVRVYGATDEAAHDLAIQVRQSLIGIEGAGLLAWRETSVVPFVDDWPAWMIVGDLTLRG